MSLTNNFESSPPSADLTSTKAELKMPPSFIHFILLFFMRYKKPKDLNLQ